MKSRLLGIDPCHSWITGNVFPNLCEGRFADNPPRASSAASNNEFPVPARTEKGREQEIPLLPIS